MNRRRISSRSAFTWVELIVVIIVLGVLLAMIPCCDIGSREAARRACCNNNLKQIGLAIHNYATAVKVLPPGTICSTAPIQPSNQYDVWGEAARTAPGFHGTSFLLRVLPFILSDTADTWDLHYSVAHGPNAAIAAIDIKGFYCPTRRNAIRSGIDNQMLLNTSWTGGGTDYGGCAGRHAAFTLQTGYNLCDATMYYEPGFFPSPFKGKDDDTPQKRWGIFGRVNVSTTFKEVADGTSNTIMTGELQRITDITPGSKDGWAVGGPATLFTTGAMMCRTGTTVTNVAKPTEGSLMNNGFWGSPGSEHANGANFGMADGSVRFLNTTMDPTIFAELGSMADGGPAKGWDY
jgi:prepilin-type processing-associated H-X9-DG protein